MKYSEKMELLLKGVKLSEIEELEDQEAKEAAEAEKLEAEKLEAEKLEAEKKKTEEKSALEAAQEMVKDLESKLQAKEDELTKLNNDFAKLTNKMTVKEEPDKYTSSDVFKELFHPVKKKEA